MRIFQIQKPPKVTEPSSSNLDSRVSNPRMSSQVQLQQLGSCTNPEALSIKKDDLGLNKDQQS